MEQKKIHSIYNTITILTIVIGMCVVLNVLFIYLVGNNMQMIQLLQKQVVQLKQDQQIIASSQEITDTYKDEIDIISKVFPNEETILTFIQSLEKYIRNSADEYALKINSLTPLPEGDKLYLLLTVVMKTDLTRLLQFLSDLEQIPYMTHVTAISMKNPEGIMKPGEVSIGLKVYVQNPFSTK